MLAGVPGSARSSAAVLVSVLEIRIGNLAGDPLILDPLLALGPSGDIPLLRYGARDRGITDGAAAENCRCCKLSVAMKKSPLVARWRSPLVAR